VEQEKGPTGEIGEGQSQKRKEVTKKDSYLVSESSEYLDLHLEVTRRERITEKLEQRSMWGVKRKKKNLKLASCLLGHSGGCHRNRLP